MSTLPDTANHSPEHAKHLIDVLHYWASQTPDKEMLRFYPQGEVAESYESRSFAEFYSKAQAIAEQLEAHQGERAILFYQSGINFLEALFACFMAGVTAVPAYPPRRNQNLERITSLIADCNPSVILSSQSVQEQSEALIREQANLPSRWINTDQVIQQAESFDGDNIPEAAPDIDPQNIAFLQYTSGSTGKPKGVMVSHHNLIHNIRMAEENFALPSDTRCISWLPLFHDMGLIGAVMMPMYWGAGSWLMPPAAFLQKPARWLELISEAGKTSHVASAAPNFAYQMCIDQVELENHPALNLSPWYFALNGAEPIRPETIHNFIDKFSRCGFPESAMGPSYGMAECTLLATTRRQQAIHQRHFDALALEQDTLVIANTEQANNSNNTSSQVMLNSSGSNCIGQTLLIVKDGKQQKEGSIGEIWLKGEHIAQGYWQQEALSQEVFHAYTDSGIGPCLTTGDRGALIDGELYITGRSKDMLVIRGRNIYPQDLEYTASHAHIALHSNNAAAFSLAPNGEEELALVLEISRHGRKDFDLDTVTLAIRKAIAKDHGLEIKHVAFIKFASIPKTSSGKIQRHRCKELYLSDALKLHDSWSSAHYNQNAMNENQVSITLPVLAEFIKNNTSDSGIASNTQLLCDYLQHSIANKLQLSLEDIPVDDPLDNTGLDSIDIIHLASSIETWASIRLDHSLFFESPHLKALSAQLLQAIIQAQGCSDQNTDQNQADVEGFL